MCAPPPAVRRSAGGVPRRAATYPSDASERASSGKKRPLVGVVPARDSSACLTKMARHCNSVVTAAGKMSSQKLLQKRLACELDALRGLLKKAELISQRGSCKGGAPTAGKKERFLASKQRPKPIQEDFNALPAKRRKISTPVEHKQKQLRAPPRISPEKRNQIAGRLSSLSEELTGHIVEFLEKQFGDADSHGEIEINFDSVKDSVLLELKTRLDKFAEESKDDKVAEESKDGKVAEEKDDKVAEESKDDKVAKGSKDDKVTEESKGKVEEEYADISIGLSCIIETGSKPSSSSFGDSDTKVVQQQSAQAKKVQDAQRAATNKAVYMPSLLYRANLRRQLLEMERAVLPDQRIDPRDVQRLGIAEYGHPSLMRQLGLVLKVVDA